MAIDVEIETLMGVAEAARKVPSPRPGRRVCPATVTRWITGGIHVGDGRRVRLEAVKVGGSWVTSAEAIGRFIAATTPAVEGPGPEPVRTAASRHRASQLAAEQLRAAGI